MLCPNPTCEADLETFEVYTSLSLLGPRLYVVCPDCAERIEVEVLVKDSLSARFPGTA